MIDWDKSPRWAKWFAVSERGVGCWFQNKPTGNQSKKYGLRWESDGAKEYIPSIIFENTNSLVSRNGLDEQTENHNTSVNAD